MPRFRKLAPLISLLVSLLGTGCGKSEPPETKQAFVGSKACSECHPKIFASWKASAHALNMTRPTPETVVGDFEKNNVYHFAGTTSKMTREGDKYYMDYDGPGSEGGKRYPIAWTLGINRHQAYLFEAEDGRLHVLPTYWNLEEDSWRDSLEGPGSGPAPLPVTHPTHWYNYGRLYNRVCMECHASQHERRYNTETDRYESTFDPQIGCEACHGPGGKHEAAWKRLDAEAARGTMVALDLESAEDNVNNCANCHARKRIYRDGFKVGEPLFDYVAPDLWDGSEIFVDGRSRTLNYRYMDYMQNRCFRRSGRRMDCGFCHSPHTLESAHDKTVVQANALCTRCHARHKSRLTEHTRHAPESDGSRCIECHMPKMPLELRMTVRDHTISSPLPGLSRSYPVPNACENCHKDEGNAWAEKYVEGWFGGSPSYEAYKARIVERAQVLTALETRGAPTPITALISWLDDAGRSVVERGSAASFLSHGLKDPAALEALLRHAKDPHPLVRYYVIGSLTQFNEPRAAAAVREAFADETRVVRVRAFEGLHIREPKLLTDPDPIVAKARAEHASRYTDARIDDPRMKSQRALGAFARGDKVEAERLLRLGVQLTWPVPNLRMDLMRLLLESGRLDEAETEAQQVIKTHPGTEWAALAEGLMHLWRGRKAEAIRVLEKARADGFDTPTVRQILAAARGR